MHIEGRSVLITGGSLGLGAALARELGKKKARVIVVARGGEKLDEVVGEIRRAGGEAHALAWDVANKESTHAIAGAASALVGDIDVLVHNASTLGPLPMPLLLDTACEDLSRVLEVNLVGPFRLSKAIVGGMVLRDRGVVVHVSSDAATNAYPKWGAYSVSKAASDHLARLWAAELASTKVRFYAVDPGEMDTQMHRDALPEADRKTLARPEDVARRLVSLLERSNDVASGSRIELAREVSP